MGDAISVALMEARMFKPENFARFHPRGSLGRRLLSKVRDEMLSVELPKVAKNCCFTSIIHTISKYKLGFTLVGIGQDNNAIITDGDLRIAIEDKGKDIFDILAQDIATVNPTTIPANASIQIAYNEMEEKRITSILVIEGTRIIGVLKK